MAGRFSKALSRICGWWDGWWGKEEVSERERLHHVCTRARDEPVLQIVSISINSSTFSLTALMPSLIHLQSLPLLSHVRRSLNVPSQLSPDWPTKGTEDTT